MGFKFYTHSTMITREATEQDLAILLEFEQGVVTAERPFNSTLIEGEIHYYDLKHLIQSPRSNRNCCRRK